jgi:hypothetical protein
VYALVDRTPALGKATYRLQLVYPSGKRAWVDGRAGIG